MKSSKIHLEFGEMSALFGVDNFDFEALRGKTFSAHDEKILNTLVLINAASKCTSENDVYYDTIVAIMNGDRFLADIDVLPVAIAGTRYQPVLEFFKKWIMRRLSLCWREQVQRVITAIDIRQRDFARMDTDLLMQISESRPMPAVENADRTISKETEEDWVECGATASNEIPPEHRAAFKQVCAEITRNQWYQSPRAFETPALFLRGTSGHLRFTQEHYNARARSTQKLMDAVKTKDSAAIAQLFRITAGWYRPLFLKVIAAIPDVTVLELFAHYVNNYQKTESDVMTALKARASALQVELQTAAYMQAIMGWTKQRIRDNSSDENSIGLKYATAKCQAKNDEYYKLVKKIIKYAPLIRDSASFAAYESIRCKSLCKIFEKQWFVAPSVLAAKKAQFKRAKSDLLTDADFE